MDWMLFKYEIGIIAFVQFILLSFLSLANSVNSIVTTCVHENGNCIENMIPSIILFILIAVWFGFIWVFAYTVQERRSRRLAVLLMGAELAIAMVALFSIKHHNDWLSLVTSIIDLVLALWVILLAFRIAKAGVSRSGSRQRQRRRRRPTVDQ